MHDGERMELKILLIAATLTGCGGADFTMTTFSDVPKDTGTVVDDDAGTVVDNDAGAKVIPPDGAGGRPARIVEMDGPSKTADAGDACTLVTHSTGTGQKWQDCTPAGTYDMNQAMQACKASGAAWCLDYKTSCGAGNAVVIGYDETRTRCTGSWGYAGAVLGYTGSPTSCESCPNRASGPMWD